MAMLRGAFKFSLSALIAALVFVTSVRAEPQYAPTEANKHIGEKATVCGVVASATYARSTRGQPTFINLDRAYPNQVFTVLIWGDHRSRFPYAPETLRGQRICATGTIQSYRGVAEIIASDPFQITKQ